MQLGAHLSIAGGVHRALERAQGLPCAAVQIFTKNQRRWHSEPLRQDQLARFRELAGQFAAVLAHAAYLINLASPDPEVHLRSIAALAEELERCRQLGIDCLILHPGSHRGAGSAWGRQRFRAGVREVCSRAGCAGVELLLETGSGGANILGSSFEELAQLVECVGEAGLRTGVCLDTCHVFAAGYELRTPGGLARTFEAFDRSLGLPLLQALHLNDSAGQIGSGRDRHAHIGQGQIGIEGFQLLVREERLRDLPGILETPKGKGLEEDRTNLARLRALEAGGGPQAGQEA
jgi:deoxyribonuclease-4